MSTNADKLVSSHDVEVKPFGGLDDFLPFRISREKFLLQDVRWRQRRNKVGGGGGGGDDPRDVGGAAVGGRRRRRRGCRWRY